MILQNAHDGSRAYRIDAGLYRLVCRNGLTVADADFAHVSIRHMDVSAEAFAKAAQSVAENTPRALEAVARWQGVQLTQAARVEFAKRAAALRWTADNPVMQALTPEKLLSPVRYGDAASDLWTTFNVVQEHLARGGEHRIVGIDERGERRRGFGERGHFTVGKRITLKRPLASAFLDQPKTGDVFEKPHAAIDAELVAATGGERLWRANGLFPFCAKRWRS